MAYYQPPTENLAKFNEKVFIDANDPGYLDATVVHKKGTETITGDKTFTGLLTANNTNTWLTASDSNILTATSYNLLETTTGINDLQAIGGTNRMWATTGGFNEMTAITGASNTILATIGGNKIQASSGGANTMTSSNTTTTANLIEATGVGGGNTLSATGSPSYNILESTGTSSYNLLDAIGTNSYNRLDAFGTNSYNQLLANALGNYNEMKSLNGFNRLSSTGLISAGVNANVLDAAGVGGSRNLLRTSTAGGETVIQHNLVQKMLVTDTATTLTNTTNTITTTTGTNSMFSTSGENRMETTTGNNNMYSSKTSGTANQIYAIAGGDNLIQTTGLGYTGILVSGVNKIAITSTTNTLTNTTNTITSTGTTAEAIRIESTNASGGVQLRAGTNGIDLLSTGAAINYMGSTSGSNRLQVNSVDKLKTEATANTLSNTAFNQLTVTDTSGYNQMSATGASGQNYMTTTGASGVNYIQSTVSGGQIIIRIVANNKLVITNSVTNLTNSGGIFIGTPTTGAYLAPGATSWTTYSDERVKRDIEPIDSALDNIINLKPVFYNYKFDETTQPKRVGFIAQDIQKIYPDIVCESRMNSPDTEVPNVLGVATSELIPYLVKAIQELNKKVEEQALLIKSLQK